jgi:hypothetical protein
MPLLRGAEVGTVDFLRREESEGWCQAPKKIIACKGLSHSLCCYLSLLTMIPSSPGNAFPGLTATLTFQQGSVMLECISDLIVPVDNIISPSRRFDDVFIVTTMFQGNTSEEMIMGKVIVNEDRTGKLEVLCNKAQHTS